MRNPRTDKNVTTEIAALNSFTLKYSGEGQSDRRQSDWLLDVHRLEACRYGLPGERQGTDTNEGGRTARTASRSTWRAGPAQEQTPGVSRGLGYHFVGGATDSEPPTRTDGELVTATSLSASGPARAEGGADGVPVAGKPIRPPLRATADRQPATDERGEYVTAGAGQVMEGGSLIGEVEQRRCGGVEAAGWSDGDRHERDGWTM